MAEDDEYKETLRRATNELESDDSNTPITKRVLCYLWDGANKVRLSCDASGKIKTG